ncbi:hypothetical protein SAMN02745166_01174 [Prosthecobacter debontii]|uniref:Uncharacterized protein n=2 Tax=Prosthecobacter debontii TaxID=48467 RepID=A0A1T4X890_9BACT|nr:hypothetical protein SAMN02745166_01174 [Prosthecobacter debontii]
MLWSIFFCLKLFDDYDSIMSLIGAPFVASLLLAISLPIVLVLGLCRKMPWFAKIWYSGRRPAASVLIASIVVLVFGRFLGMQEPYTYTNSVGDTVTASRLHSFVALPAFFLATFSLLYWPVGGQPYQTQDDHISLTDEAEQNTGGNGS